MKTIYCLQIHNLSPSTPQENKILLDLLSQHTNNLQFSIMLAATTTKIKKKLDFNEFLVFYHSPIPLPSIKTKLFTIFNNDDDAQKFKQLNADTYYHLVGINRVRTLSVGEGRYLVDLLNRISSLLDDNYTPKSTKRGRNSYV